MGTIRIRLTDDQKDRLKALASHRGTSLNKLFEDFTVRALAEFDAENRFRQRAAKGNPARGLAILDLVDIGHGTYSKG